MELQEGYDLAHDPVQAPQGRAQGGQGGGDGQVGQAREQTRHQQRQVGEELKRGIEFVFNSDMFYLITLK